MKLLMILILFVPIITFSQVERPKWDYPVKPGSEEWRQFKSTDDMYIACQIPDDILRQLNTEDLVHICLNFPATPQFLLFNTPQDCFMAFYSNFNGIRELFNRKDMGYYLINRYTKMSMSDFNPLWPLHEQGKYISQYKFIEAILAQSQVIKSLNSEERKSLMKEVIRKIDEKLVKRDLFSGNNIQINLWVMAKILSYENKLYIPNMNIKDVQTFLDSGMPVDVDVNSIYELAKKM
ncbi:MAG: hypothetical protein Q8S54_16055 [Bacteroidota bacterium]|nr:hypothetical protein [Odoribacter sp.]MDP3644685.1 hypothetical protein [Bacteroidota bacterium]